MAMQLLRLVESSDLKRCSTLDELRRYVGKCPRVPLKSIYPIGVRPQAKLTQLKEPRPESGPIRKIRAAMRNTETDQRTHFLQDFPVDIGTLMCNDQSLVWYKLLEKMGITGQPVYLLDNNAP